MSAPSVNLPVIAVTGLAFEAEIAAGPGVRALCGGGKRLRRLLEEAIGGGCRGVMSFGIAGGLGRDLRPGALVVARAVRTEDGRIWPADSGWSTALMRALPGAKLGDIAAVNAPVADIAAKSRLAATGALTVDMESHVAAEMAAARGLPFAALRVVADPADRALPPAALAGMSETGRPDLGAVLRSLARRPGQLPALIRVARDTGRARAALLRRRRILDAHLGMPHGLGSPDLVELGLDMP